MIELDVGLFLKKVFIHIVWNAGLFFLTFDTDFISSFFYTGKMCFVLITCDDRLMFYIVGLQIFSCVIGYKLLIFLSGQYILYWIWSILIHVYHFYCQFMIKGFLVLKAAINYWFLVIYIHFIAIETFSFLYRLLFLFM